MRNLFNIQIQFVIILTSILYILLMAFSSAGAQQNSGTIAQGYFAENGAEGIVAGAVVSIKAGSKNVELATLESTPRLLGVVDENPLVAITSENQRIQVVLNGTTNVLVSDINGPIKASDKITASPIAGIGMLATADNQIVGTAHSDFNTESSETRTIADNKGNSRTVHIGYVPMQVGVAYYQAPGSNFLPPFIQNIANSLAGRPVSLIRIAIASILILMGFIYVGVLTYTAVRTAMNSIGRNPLASGAIRKGLFQTGIVSVSVLAATLLGSYFVISL